jgi:signal transduction histidine kinase
MLTTRSARALVHRAAELEAERSRAERQQAQLLMESKVGALGHMVAGISHELNTPLGAVRSCAELTPRALDNIEAGLSQPGDAAIARKAARAAGALRTSGASILEATGRIAQTLSTLRNFARLDQAELQRTDINADLDDALKLLSVGSSGIEIVRDYAELPDVLCNPGQLNQVFMTILTNGCQAIEEKGTITIRTRAAGDKVQLSIADTGRGMNEQQLGSLFDIQLSSGSDARVAASFGLATAQNTIHRHGGRISVESTPGEGATFTIELPVAKG